MLKKNKVNDIVSFRVDRITRNFRDSVLIDELRIKYKVRLHFIDDRLVLTQESRSNDIIQWDFKVIFAKSQLEKIKEDGVNTKMSKLERGELPWVAPFWLQQRNHRNTPQNRIARRL
ncbi:MAG: recombinase family protein [Candidatus Microsaccharimonas sossegonensis]|uniref:Recombinase family protein n=1 Tax=Candidatus Microsaccharimonas sossegonensis TaxID=2506948 RepID=A0A4Q0AJ96_9BACT|nr:MAG: recombinase family protein [Candidatus Microsaccharimonas sossegonensis]